MSRYIDADKLTEELRSMNVGGELFGTAVDFAISILEDKAPSVRTKQIKYFDEDEAVWKIGEVIVDEQRRE